MQVQILKFRNQLEKHRGKPLDAAGRALVQEIMEWMLTEYGGLSVAAQPLLLAQHKGNFQAVLESLPNNSAAVLAQQQITGHAPTRTPFLKYMPQFLATSTRKESARYATEQMCKEFAAACRLSLEELATDAGEDAVQEWLDHIRIERNLGQKSLRHAMTSINAYWRWMKVRKKVTGSGPFHHRDTSDGRKEGEAVAGRRGEGPAFAMSDLPRLWRAAEAKGDWMLAAFILLSAFTGGRRNAICNLTPDSIDQDRDSGIWYVHFDDKTPAGKRNVPLSDFILPLVRWLCENPDPNGGFLIHDTGYNKQNNTRGGKIWHRFTKLLVELGLAGKGHNMHSIRKNFQQAMQPYQQAGKVDMTTVEVIMGHKISNFTHRKYGYKPPMTLKYEAIKFVTYPGATPPQMGRRTSH